MWRNRLKQIYLTDGFWLLAALVICQLPYWLPAYEFFPAHDTQASFHAFHNAYREYFFHGTLPLWRPYETMGIKAIAYNIINLGPAQMAILPIGKLLGVTNALSLFSAAMFLEMLFLLCGMALLSRLYCKNLWSRVLIYFLMAAVTRWGVQMYYNLQVFYHLPLAIFLGIRFFQTGRFYFLILMGATMMLSVVGGIPYFVPVQLLLLLSFFTPYYFLNKRPKINFPKAYEWLLGAAITVVGLIIVDCVLNLRGGLRNLTPGREDNGMIVGLVNFLGSAPVQADPTSFWEFLFAVPSGIEGANISFFGVFALGMIVALFLISDKRLWLPPMIATGVILLFSTAQVSFVGPFFYYFIPLGSTVRYLGFFKLMARPLFILLAGIGFDEVTRKGNDPRVNAALAVFFGGVSAILLAFQLFQIELPYEHSRILHSFSFISAICAFLLCLYCVRCFWNKRPLHSIVLLAVAVVEILSFSYAHQVASEDKKLHLSKSLFKEEMEKIRIKPMTYINTRGPSPELVDHLLFSDPHPYRPNTLQVDLCVPLGGLDWIAESSDELVAARGVRYHTEINQDPVLAKAVGCGTSKIQILTRFKVAPDVQTAARYIRSSNDIADVPVFVASEVPNQTGDMSGGSWKVENFSSNSIEISTKTSASAWLMYMDAYHPSWSATIDGQPAPIARANLAFKSVMVPPGEHRVRFEYGTWRDRIWTWGFFAMGILFWPIIFTLLFFTFTAPQAWRKG